MSHRNGGAWALALWLSSEGLFGLSLPAVAEDSRSNAGAPAAEVKAPPKVRKWRGTVAGKKKVAKK